MVNDVGLVEDGNKEGHEDGDDAGKQEGHSVTKVLVHALTISGVVLE